MKLDAAILFFTWAFIVIAWCFPGLLRIAGALLYALADASEILQSGFRSYRKTGPPLPRKAPAGADATTNETHREVVQALMSQGEPRKKAEQRVSRAAGELPSNAGFDELWRKAVAA